MENKLVIFFLSSILAVVFMLFVLLFFMVNYHRKMLRTQKQTFQQILEATEMESQRIGQNLHDDLGPMLASIKLSISGVLMSDEIDDGSRKILEMGRDYLSDSIHSVRDQAHVLNAANLKTKTLNQLLAERKEILESGGEWEVNFICLTKEIEISPSARLMLFRICNELIYNSIKHSGGDTIHLSFVRNGNNVELNYFDNGDTQMKVSAVTGIGMKGIQSRVKFLDGTMELFEQKGFRANFVFPLVSLKNSAEIVA